MPITTAHFQQRLAERQQTGLFRQRRELQQRTGNQVNYQGQNYLSFMSFDYLGMAQHPQVINALKSAAEFYGAGSSSSQLLGGHYSSHRELEQALANFTGHQRALIFSSGYMANLAVATALLNAEDRIFHDKLNHASLIDASLFSAANFKRYHHLDSDHLEQQLKQSSNRNWICSDGVFSMDGDLAPLPRLVELSQRYQTGLIIDDAHGFGLLGKQGGGVCQHFNCHGKTDILVIPFGKALGTMGAAVLGSDILIETILQFARSYIYTTALPPAWAAATLMSLQLIQQDNWRRTHLQQLIQTFQLKAQQLKLPVLPSNTAIQSLLLGQPEHTMRCAERLKARGILVSAVRPPTVPTNTSRLRINLSVNHQIEDVNHLLEVLLEIYHDC